MTISRLVPVLCALALVASPLTPAFSAAATKDVYAGWTKPGPPPLERFIEPLRLTVAQQLKLKPIFEDAQIKAANDQRERGEGHAPNPVADASAIVARETAFRERLASELTAGQLKQYELLTAAHFTKLRAANPALPAIESSSTADAAATPAP
jgi:hypothetical protein